MTAVGLRYPGESATEVVLVPDAPMHTLAGLQRLEEEAGSRTAERVSR